MEKILSKNIDSKKIKIANITPIKNISSVESLEKKEQLLFVIPNYNASHKGLDFILKLSHLIPNNYKILIVGNKLSEKQLVSGQQSNIINLNQVDTEELDRLYKESKIRACSGLSMLPFGGVILLTIDSNTSLMPIPSLALV